MRLADELQIYFDSDGRKGPVTLNHSFFDLGLMKGNFHGDMKIIGTSKSADWSFFRGELSSTFPSYRDVPNEHYDS